MNQGKLFNQILPDSRDNKKLLANNYRQATNENKCLDCVYYMFSEFINKNACYLVNQNKEVDPNYICDKFHTGEL
jgi:hypothetical protein